MAFMGYYGQTQNMANLSPDNIFVSYFLAALVEIPCWSVPFVIGLIWFSFHQLQETFFPGRLGCRWPLLVFFLISGTCGVVYGALPEDNATLQLSVGLMGKMAVTGAYYICQQYSSEVFPTVVRGQGVHWAYFIHTSYFIHPYIQNDHFEWGKSYGHKINQNMRISNTLNKILIQSHPWQILFWYFVFSWPCVRWLEALLSLLPQWFVASSKSSDKPYLGAYLIQYYIWCCICCTYR